MTCLALPIWLFTRRAFVSLSVGPPRIDLPVPCVAVAGSAAQRLDGRVRRPAFTEKPDDLQQLRPAAQRHRVGC